MGNSASTSQQTKTTSPSPITAYKRYRSNSLGSHNDDQQSISAQLHLPLSKQLPMTEPTITIAASQSTTGTKTNAQSIANPKTVSYQGSSSTTESINISSSPKLVPGRSGWISSTSSPLYGSNSLSSSASSSSQQPYLSNYQQYQQSSQKRQSISGPYYRARGLSVSQQEPADDDLIFTTASSSSPSTSYQQQASHSLQIQGNLYQSSSLTILSSSPQQPPSLRIQQLHTNPSSSSSSSSSSASPSPFNKSDMVSKEKVQVNTEVRTTIITWSHGGNDVYVTGTFNGWKRKIKLIKSTHDFNTVLDLPLGTHRLKFIVDDEWKCSNDMETATDLDGNLVNYIQVMDEDDIEGELDLDSSDDGNGFTSTSTKRYTSEIPKELLLYSNVIQKQREDGSSGGMDYASQRRSVMEWQRNQPQPPTLPPHLEKVLLNSQVLSNEDNSVLPVPNHVSLNHMYACSIKDDVMALSTTTRYRNKYVTTMYYKPVI